MGSTIPVIILKAVKLRPDLLHPKVARLFAAFITACALSHLAGLLTLWVPAYGLQGVIKVATAVEGDMGGEDGERSTARPEQGTGQRNQEERLAGRT